MTRINSFSQSDDWHNELESLRFQAEGRIVPNHRHVVSNQVSPRWISKPLPDARYRWSNPILEPSGFLADKRSARRRGGRTRTLAFRLFTSRSFVSEKTSGFQKGSQIQATRWNCDCVIKYTCTVFHLLACAHLPLTPGGADGCAQAIHLSSLLSLHHYSSSRMLGDVSVGSED